MSAKTSTEIAINIPELLEAILLKLDIRTLLVSAQRVNRYWHGLVSESPDLQRALFFRPDHTATRSENPLLASTFRCCFPHLHQTSADHLMLIPRTVESLGGASMWLSTLYPIWQNREAFARRTASWRRMLVQQPPLNDIGSIWIILTPDLAESMEVLHAPALPQPIDAPVRMEALLAEVLMRDRLPNQNPSRTMRSSFRVIWNAVPSTFTDAQLAGIIDQQIQRYDLVVNHVLDFTQIIPFNQATLLLRYILDAEMDNEGNHELVQLDVGLDSDISESSLD
ncbi:hypothetical protein F4780DRAFT_225815 [Xylariomycetidae sp. FL0641]|nr:hypothetical protein F4780DRAFT_225815 [Xylariomycetidae sp. FL0641]